MSVRTFSSHANAAEGSSAPISLSDRSTPLAAVMAESMQQATPYDAAKRAPLAASPVLCSVSVLAMARRPAESSDVFMSRRNAGEEKMWDVGEC